MGVKEVVASSAGAGSGDREPYLASPGYRRAAGEMGQVGGLRVATAGPTLTSPMSALAARLALHKLSRRHRTQGAGAGGRPEVEAGLERVGRGRVGGDGWWERLAGVMQ
jgi:hypothetical protein